MNLQAFALIVALSTASALAKDVPRKCMDGTMSIFVESAAVPTNRLSEKFPRVEYEGAAGVEFEDKKARGKIVWDELPADVKVDVARIAEYRGHAIYRATYAWSEGGSPARCMLLAYCDDAIAITRPFFIAGDEQLSSVEAWITSTKAEPFGLEVHVDWKGNGVAWFSFAYGFDASGPHPVSRSDGGRRQETKTRRF
jgi:hypothetical protein